MTGYLLDTNVLPELLKKRPEPAIVRSLNVIPAEDLFTSSVCVMELRRGARVTGRQALSANSWSATTPQNMDAR